MYRVVEAAAAATTATAEATAAATATATAAAATAAAVMGAIRIDPIIGRLSKICCVPVSQYIVETVK